jgi:hypothetical protein
LEYERKINFNENLWIQIKEKQFGEKNIKIVYINGKNRQEVFNVREELVKHMRGTELKDLDEV